MRYTRLRRQIESGSLVGGHGSPPTNSPSKREHSSTATSKTDSPTKSEIATTDADAECKDDPETIVVDKMLGAKRRRLSLRERKVEVKVERRGSGEDGSESDSGSEGSEWESEDEIPLAKLKKARIEGPPRKLVSPSCQTFVPASKSPDRTVRGPAPSPEVQRAAAPSFENLGISSARVQEGGQLRLQDEGYASGPRIEVPRYMPQMPLHPLLTPYGEAFAPQLIGHDYGGWKQGLYQHPGLEWGWESINIPQRTFEDVQWVPRKSF